MLDKSNKKSKSLRLSSNRSQTVSLPRQKRSEGVVRIVGGIFKRTPIPVEDHLGLRPTPERVRETVFDWLTHLLGGMQGRRVCDMFAGSGAMGLEAASRGAEHVLSIEKDRKAYKNISSIVKKLHAENQMEVLCADAFVRLGRDDEEKFDVVFIDPPFALELQAKAVDAVRNHLSVDAIVYVESNVPFGEDEFLFGPGLRKIRSGKAGQVYYVLLKNEAEN